MRKARKKGRLNAPGVLWRPWDEEWSTDDSTAEQSRARQKLVEDPGFLGQLQLVAERAIEAREGRMREDA